ncbi:MAG TPA: cytidine deaminase [Bacilli bacterium]
MNIDEKLYEAVLQAYRNAYTPYSHFNVGAALLLADGKIITGSNIENASYGLSNCAERSALFAAYSQGYRKNDIKRMMIIGNTDRPISPCGACRQVMSELLDPEIEVVLTNLNKEYKIMKVKDFLPYSFSDGDLDGKGV